MKPVRTALLALILTLSAIAAPALAASFSTDQSDLWWANPPGSQSGWGMQLVQRKSTIFATLFVYGKTTSPTWYVATMVPTIPNTPGTWSGDLYATTGPWFGTVPFDPALVTATKVGTMTWNADTVNTGTVNYTVNKVAVTKHVVRETLVNEDYSGEFIGEVNISYFGSCATTPSLMAYASLGVVQSGTLITLTLAIHPANPGYPAACTYNGTLTQYGQMGYVVGDYSCTDGSAGSFTFSELQVTEISLNGVVSSLSNGCIQNGWFVGGR